MSENSQVVIYDQQNTLPTILPDTNKKVLFNSMQESKPIAEIVDKKFKIEGLYPEQVWVPKKHDVNGEMVEDENGEMVERTRLTVFTNIGVFHSHSLTFNKSVLKILNLFGEDYANMQYVAKSRMKDKKVYYVLQIV